MAPLPRLWSGGHRIATPPASRDPPRHGVVRLGRSSQRPLHRAYQQGPESAQRWREADCPATQKLAKQEDGGDLPRRGGWVRSDGHCGTTLGTPGQDFGGADDGDPLRDDPDLSGLRPRAAVLHGNCQRVTPPCSSSSWVGSPTARSARGSSSWKIAPPTKGRRVQDLVAKTKGKLRLFHAPPHPPQPEPDKRIWQHVKIRRVGRRVVTGPAQFHELALTSRRRLQEPPASVRGFLRARSPPHPLTCRLTNARISAAFTKGIGPQ